MSDDPRDDREGWGRQYGMDRMAVWCGNTDPDRGGGLEWRHIHTIATMYGGESQGFEWRRPMVWDPGKDHHRSVDRGICQLNSYWWDHVPDDIAYAPRQAWRLVLEWLHTEAAKGTKGATAWDWGPLLDWQWHGYGSTGYKAALPGARDAVNEQRTAQGLDPI